jgi:tetratricopeptide (TPR) repeat protein
LALNPNNFETNFSLGVLYFNEAAEMASAANNLKSDDAFAKAKQKYDQKYKEAEPYLEKAFELNPHDKDAGNSLKQLYSRTG